MPWTEAILILCLWEHADHGAIFCLEHSDFGLAHSHFWKWFLASASPSLLASWSAPSWLLILSALLVIHSGWGRAEKSEVFYVSGCRPYEVMTVFCRDIRSVFPIETGGISGAESITGAGSERSGLGDKAGEVMMVVMSTQLKEVGAKEQTEQGEWAGFYTQPRKGQSRRYCEIKETF